MKNHGKQIFRRVFAKGFLMAPLACLTLAGCQDTEFDEYYERPSWLDAPAWNILERRGDCSNYLQLVEKTLYSKQLEGSGSYTFFVPTDAAFQAFFAENPYGYSSVADIPADVASDIVSSTMLYNQYPCDSLGNTLDGYNTWSTGAAYKHQTPSYEVLSRDYVKGDSIWVYDSYSLSWQGENWNNYRYLPCFTENYFKANGLTESDFKHFFEEGVWSTYGNVLDARVLEVSEGSGDLYCENGVIHLVDKVVLPLKNLDDMICEYPEMETTALPEKAQGGAWDFFKKLIYHRQGDGNYQFLSYTEDVEMTHYFEKMYPDLDLSTLKVRAYNMNPSLNVEQYSGNVEGETNYNSGATLWLPTHEVLEDYVENRILSYVEHDGWKDSQEAFDRAFNNLSESVMPGLFYSLYTDGVVWPTYYKTAQNGIGSNEFINGGRSGNEFASVVQSSAFASNGLYHIINFMPKTSAFEGVGSRFLLDPAYSYMEQAFAGTYRSTIYYNMMLSKLANYDQVNLGVILYPNSLLKAWDGIVYDAVDTRFENGAGTSVATSVNTMSTLGYVERDSLDKIDFEEDALQGAYDGWSFTNSYNGNVIRYKKTGNVINGKPEIMVQSNWAIQNDPAQTFESLYDAGQMPQAATPTTDYYTSIIKDPSYDQYLNGNVYLVNEGSVPLFYELEITSPSGVAYVPLYRSAADELEIYLRADSALAAAGKLDAKHSHTMFKKYWDYAKGANTPPAISGRATILVPTDEALQYAIDQGMITAYEDMLKGAISNAEAFYPDSAAALINPYIIVSDIYPDDGTSNLYATNTWSCPNVPIDLTNFPVSTSLRPMSNDWEDLMSGTTRMSVTISKTAGDHRLKFAGRSYVQGQDVAVDAYGADEYSNGQFTNTVVRELGQSNIIANNAVIHSFDGFLIYKVRAR